MEKKIDIPAGTDRVTLSIAKNEHAEGTTLKQALMTVPSDTNVVVRVLERARLNDQRLYWDMWLPTISPSEAEETDKRSARVTAFAECQLCDTLTLLDERTVTGMTLREVGSGGTAFVFEVEA